MEKEKGITENSSVLSLRGTSQTQSASSYIMKLNPYSDHLKYVFKFEIQPLYSFLLSSFSSYSIKTGYCGLYNIQSRFMIPKSSNSPYRIPFS